MIDPKLIHLYFGLFHTFCHTDSPINTNKKINLKNNNPPGTKFIWRSALDLNEIPNWPFSFILGGRASHEKPRQFRKKIQTKLYEKHV
jgi:hypothetical protein